MKNKSIYIVGYDANMRGGVVQVTDVLLNHIEDIRLHAYLRYYSPLSKALIHYLKSIFIFLYFLLRGKVSMVHLIVASRGDTIRCVPYLLMCKLFRIKVCVQYHKCMASILDSFSNVFLRNMIFASLKIPKVHCFLSLTLLDNFAKSYPYKIKSCVIPNAIKDLWFDGICKSFVERHTDIVFLGRWSAEKGVDDLLSCLRRLSPQFNCSVYSNKVPSIQIDNVCFNNWVNELEVKDIISNSKLLVLPSYSEAYPTVLLEALARGTPFVATSIAGIPDIARDSLGGVLFEAGNVEQFTASVVSILADSGRWEKMSQNGRDWVEATCRVDKIVPIWRKLYLEVLSDNV